MGKNNRSQRGTKRTDEIENFVMFLIRNRFEININAYTEDDEYFVEVSLLNSIGKEVIWSIYSNPYTISNCINKTIWRYLEDSTNDSYEEAQEMYGIWLAQ